MDRKHRVPIILLILLGLFTIFTGINPRNFIPWLLEALAVWLFVVFLILTYNKYRMPNHIYIMLFLFLLLPITGGYFGFDNVPYGELFDFSGKGINQYDRVIHFLYGALLMPFVFIFLEKSTSLNKKFWLYFLPIMVLLAGGAIYEIAEWSSALFLAPNDVGNWIGLKGDNFDPQKDMLLGLIGSLVTTGIMIITKKKSK